MLNSINNDKGAERSAPLLIKMKNGDTRIVKRSELTDEMTVIKELTKTVMTKNDFRPC